MSLFKNEKLDKVNERLSKLKSKRDEIRNSIIEMEAALQQTAELYATGQIDEKDIEEAQEFLKERRQELADVESMIPKVEAVKKKVAVESIPFVKEARQKKIERRQKEYDEQVKVVMEAKNELLRELAKLGRIKNTDNSEASEVNAVLRELGDNTLSGMVHERTVIPGGFTNPSDCLGLSTELQLKVYKDGSIPAWASNKK